MQPQFWHERWKLGQTAFHQPVVDRHLLQYWPLLNLPRAARVFVPLCGKSLDLLWLRDRGHAVLGVELSSVAIETLCLEQGIPARRRTRGAFEAYESAGLELLCGDLFALTRELLGNAAAVFDRASLIAWPPELRDRYVQHMTALTPPGTQTLLVCLEYDQPQMNGPPFAVTGAEVKRLYGENHDIHVLGRHDVLEREPRFKSRGVTQLHEVCYGMVRL